VKRKTGARKEAWPPTPWPEHGAVVDGAHEEAPDAAERRWREIRYRMVLEDQTELISRYLADGTVIYVNPAYCRFFGKTETELVGHSWHPAAHPDDIAMIEAKLGEISPSHPVVVIENRVISGAGTTCWVQFVNRGLFDEQGRLRELQSVGRDITERRQAEQELRLAQQKLHALFAASDRMLEDQRKEIARDLHDQLGALLTTMLFRLEALKTCAPDDPAFRQEWQRIRALVQEASQASRDICNSLRPPALDDLGLVATCRWYLERWAGLVGIEVKARFARLHHEPDERLRTDLFRIFQELLTNVARHAGATRVRVTLADGRRGLCLRVVDNGHGFPSASGTGSPPGYGLCGVQERIARYGGRVEIASDTRGTTIRVEVPERSA
jgi:PAS domain S-box-containing protein